MKHSRSVPALRTLTAHRRVRPSLPLVLLLLIGVPAFSQGPSALNGASIENYFAFLASSSAALVSFDWDSEGVLHYSVGDPNYGLKLEVYKQTEAGPIAVYQSAEVWAGSQLACIGRNIYFNDGGDFMRSDFNYYLYDAAGPGSVSPLLEAPYGASLWGLTARGPGEFLASGSAATWGPAAIFFSRLSASGYLESSPPVHLGEIGESPGPLAFDDTGALYYVPGYAASGTAFLYRWSAAEVNAALADPVGSSLQPGGHQWATLPSPFSGATGIATDSPGNVYVTATAWGSPSQLVVFRHASAAPLVAAEYPGRLETVRFRNDAIYFSCADGVFRLPMLDVDSSLESTQVIAAPGGAAVFAVSATGGIGEKHFQWHRRNGSEAPVAVGSDLPHYSMTTRSEDTGSVFYCIVTDSVSSMESPHFTLTVQEPVPVGSFWSLMCVFISMAASGCLVAANRLRFRVYPRR